MTDKDVLDRLAEVVGYGNVRSCSWKDSTYPNRKPTFVWDIGGIDKVEPLLKAIRPYMGQRRGKKIDKMLALVPTLGRRGYRNYESKVA